MNLKADVGNVYPPATFVWFNDDLEIAKNTDSISIDVNALDNDKYVSGMDFRI